MRYWKKFFTVSMVRECKGGTGDRCLGRLWIPHP